MSMPVRGRGPPVRRPNARRHPFPVPDDADEYRTLSGIARLLNVNGKLSADTVPTLISTPHIRIAASVATTAPAM
jgi:hypothetical protein